MSRFPPIYLNNRENNIVSSILEEEMSELKDATFSTQSNISMNDQQNTKTFQNWDYKISRTQFSPKPQEQVYTNNISIDNYQSEKYQKQDEQSIKLENSNNFLINNSDETNNTENNLKKFDISELKNEVDNLMSHVRTVKNQKASFDNKVSQELKHRSPIQSIKEKETSFTRIDSSTHSPFAFQTASETQNIKRDSPQKVQNQYENNDMNSSVASLFSSKWQNYDNYNSGTYFKSSEDNRYSLPHVDFPDFHDKYSHSRSPYSKFSKNSIGDEEENGEGPFVLPQAQFPDAPKVLQYKFSRRPDSSKKDLADLDGLRKENFNLRAEILKLEKRLQLEEEEHKKLVNSLEKSERIRAEYRTKIEQQSH